MTYHYDLQVIAHRGMSNISPENTMVAFRRAIEIGANAIETDVQMTKDGELVLIHDETVNRTTSGTGNVKDYTLKDIKKLDAGSWFSSIYANERIPTLRELFDLLIISPLWVNIEIKDGFALYPGIEEKLVEMVKEYHLENRVIFSSFNHYSIVKMKQLNSHLNTAILYGEGLYEPWEYAAKIGCMALHPSKKVVFPEIINGAHQNGMKVYPYTIDDKNEMTSLINMQVDGIMTNHPDRLILLLKELGLRG